MKQLLLSCSVLLSTLAVGQVDGIYVCDASDFQNPPWKIIRYALDGSSPVDFVTDQLSWPQDIFFLKDSNVVLISNFTSNRITRHNATTGAYINNFATGLNGPTRMRLGPDSSLYVLQWNGSGQVRRYALDGIFLGEFTSVGVPQSIGMDWDTAGNLYVSSYYDDLVRRYDPQGNDLGLFISSDLVGPTNIWFNAAGELLVLDYDGASVKRFDAAGNYLGPYITGLGQSEGYAILPDSTLLIGNGATSSVKRYTADGTYVDDIIATGSGGLINPNAIVVVGSSVGISERPSEHRQFSVVPNTGRTFNLKLEHNAAIDRMEVRNAHGAMLRRLHSTEWNASGEACGMYHIIVRWRDGTHSVAQVEVMD